MLVALLGGRLGLWSPGDADRVGEQVEVGQLGGGGVKALPQQRERLDAVEQVGLDPGAGERAPGSAPVSARLSTAAAWCAAQVGFSRARG